VKVTNLSPLRWPGRGALSLSYHWRHPDGSLVVFDGHRSALVRAIGPGGRTTRECVVVAPNTPGSYLLELDLVHGESAWFSAAGSSPLRSEAVVVGIQPDDLDELDYEQSFAEADLARNHWGVVGPASLEQFIELGRSRLEMLQGLGLVPGSRVLDVGCGTGSLAEPLSRFLDDDGCYLGTDLSGIAVRFCQEKYARPNFTFRRNEMTKLPVDAGLFDFVVFFSVLTHTYPQETRALLSEAARALAPGGAIVADVFEADLPGASVGTRAMVVLDRAGFSAMVGEAGLAPEVVGEMEWRGSSSLRISRVLRRLVKASDRGEDAYRA
jgi:SAM-dependent methyltransferase